MSDVVIVGGGIIGCATAYYLARAGVDVTVLERGAVSGEASGAAAGILAALSDHGERPSIFKQLCDQSLTLFDSLLPALAETGIDVRHRRSAILDLAVTETEAVDLLHQFERRQETTDVRWLDSTEALRLEPAISTKTVAAMFTPNAQYLDPQRLTQAIGEAAKRAGATILEHEPVTRFLRRGDKLHGVRTKHGDIEAATVVLAGGPWTMQMARQLGTHIPVRPVRGQMLSLDGPPGGLNHMIWGSGAYLVPREDGQTYVGATVEEVGYRKQTTITGLRSLQSGAALQVPALAGARRRLAWAGLRPATPDGLPVMGRLPGWRNVWLSSGHFRNGILLAPLSGQLMADSIMGDKPEPLLAQLSPQRFA